MNYRIKPHEQIQQTKSKINIPHKTPLFCFCHIAQDKESREILKDKIKCKDFLDSIMIISELKIMSEIQYIQSEQVVNTEQYFIFKI